MCSDTSGKITIPSIGGAQYTYVILDSATRTGFGGGLIRKSDITPVTDKMIRTELTGDNANTVIKEFKTDGDRSNYNSKKYNDMLNGHLLPGVSL